jgi:hypothetical protein
MQDCNNPTAVHFYTGTPPQLHHKIQVLGATQQHDSVRHYNSSWNGTAIPHLFPTWTVHAAYDVRHNNWVSDAAAMNKKFSTALFTSAEYSQTFRGHCCNRPLEWQCTSS